MHQPQALGEKFTTMLSLFTTCEEPLEGIGSNSKLVFAELCAKHFNWAGFLFLNPSPSSKTFLRKIYISAWKTRGGLELINENSLSPMSISHTRASLLVGNTQSLNSEDAPSETQRTCCLNTGFKMQPETHAKNSHR